MPGSIVSFPTSPGDLHHGVLEMLKVRGVNNYNTTSGQTVGRPLDVEWVLIDNPDPEPFSADGYDVYRQGFAKGGAIFDRLEGCWYGDASIYFVVTNGGDAEAGAGVAVSSPADIAAAFSRSSSSRPAPRCSTRRTTSAPLRVVD